MGKRNGRYCCECDFCAVGPCEGRAYCLFLTDDSGYGHTLFCVAHAPLVGTHARTYLAAHPGVAVDPECADAWAVIEAEREYAARCVVVAAHQATHTMAEANELNEQQYRDMYALIGPLVGSVCMPTHQQFCPHCGQPMVASTPAQDAPKDVSADRGPAPVMPAPTKQKTWRDEPGML
jgi:hypothetical protein